MILPTSAVNYNSLYRPSIHRAGGCALTGAMAARERAGRPSRFGGFVEGRGAGQEVRNPRHSSTIELWLVRRRPPTRAATRVVNGQADIGRDVLRPIWPRKGRGVTSVPRSSREGRRGTHYLLCPRRAREGINPFASVRLRRTRRRGQKGRGGQPPATIGPGTEQF